MRIIMNSNNVVQLSNILDILDMYEDTNKTVIETEIHSLNTEILTLVRECMQLNKDIENKCKCIRCLYNIVYKRNQNELLCRIVKYMTQYKMMNIHEEDDKKFIKACESGTIEEINDFLSNKRNVRTGYEYLFTRIYILICKIGRLDILTYLMEYDVNNYNILKKPLVSEMNLMTACEFGQLHIIEYILYYTHYIKHEIDIHHDNELFFRLACKSQNTEAVKFLFEYSKLYNNTHIININAMNDHAYILAYEKSNLGMIKYLLECGKEHGYNVNIHIRNEEAFLMACKIGHLELVKYLIEFGELNNDRIYIHINDDEALGVSCRNGHIDIVKYLMEYGEKINSKFNIHKYDEIIFYMACLSGKLEIIKYLLKLDKINIHAHNDRVFTDIHNDEITKYLIEQCKEDTQEVFDKLFENICKSGNLEILKYLIKFSEVYKFSPGINNNNFELIFISCNFDICEYLISYYYKKNYGSFFIAITDNNDLLVNWMYPRHNIASYIVLMFKDGFKQCCRKQHKISNQSINETRLYNIYYVSQDIDFIYCNSQIIFRYKDAFYYKNKFHFSSFYIDI